MTEEIGQRKNDHLDLAKKSQISSVAPQNNGQRERPNYEPLFATTPLTPRSYLHFDKKKFEQSGPHFDLNIFGKKALFPLWISSMTGGGTKALRLNQVLAKGAAYFGLGMGLGSCRVLLEEKIESKNNISFSKAPSFPDFNLREIIGPNLPLAANLGIAQIQALISKYKLDNALEILQEMLDSLKADGLFIHLNLLQEFLQPEGDMILTPPVETLQALLSKAPFKMGIKEVGQGLGPRSLKAIYEMPFEVLEFAAYGGTNFSFLEVLRGGPKDLLPLAYVGHDAQEMVTNSLLILKELGPLRKCHRVIISGGISDFVQGHFYREKLKEVGLKTFYGQAQSMLAQAQNGEEALFNYIHNQLLGLQMAQNCLEIAPPKES